MGTGTYAKQCPEYFDGVTVEGVEIDQKITDLAGGIFELPEEVKVTTYDGRAYLGAVDETYDVIMVDAYQDITNPFQMFLSGILHHGAGSSERGRVMVVNMNMHTDEEGNINQYLSDTIASVFDTVYTVDVAHTTNRELVRVQNRRGNPPVWRRGCGAGRQ